MTFQEKASCLCCGFLGYPLETHLTQFFQKLKNISYKACIGGNPIFSVETNRTSIKKRQRSLIRKWYQELISREWRLQIIILLSFFLIYLYFKFFLYKNQTQKPELTHRGIKSKSRSGSSRQLGISLSGLRAAWPKGLNKRPGCESESHYSTDR